MAFPKAANYNQLANGAFSPVIYSKKVQKAFRKSSVIEDVTNTDYWGEISQMGDSVRIIKEPDIDVSSYARGTQLATQTLTDQDFSMVIDQANYYQFAIDDIEAAHSHVNFQDLATDRAAYKLKDHFDAHCLGYISGWTSSTSQGTTTWSRNTTVNGSKANTSAGADELLPDNKLDITHFGGSDLGGTSEVTSVAVRSTTTAGGIATPLSMLNRIGRLMDQANVDTEGRWVVCDPVWYEILMDEDSKFINADYLPNSGSNTLYNGKVSSNTIRGFRIYKSNNLPYVGTGPGTTATGGSETNFGVIVAGHDSAMATAQTMNKTETFRSPDTFADVVRGVQMFGRKILRPECLFTVNYNKHS